VRRLLPNIATGVSLLLFVAVAGLWVRSYFRGDVVGFAAGPPPPAVSSEWFVRSNYGVLYFARNDNWLRGFDPRPVQWQSHPPDRFFCGPVVQASFVLGPFSVGGMKGRTMSHAALTLPHWLPAGAAALGPVLCLRRFLRTRSRRSRGLCPRCGYDRRATPGRCPECGDETVPGGAAPTARSPAPAETA
jgi:hypothetical protein